MRGGEGGGAFEARLRRVTRSRADEVALTRGGDAVAADDQHAFFFFFFFFFFFVALHQAIERGIQLGVHLAPRCVGIVPLDDLVRAPPERDDGTVLGHERLHLGIVEDHGVRLVAEEPGPVLGQLAGDRGARDVHRMELGARGPGEQLADLVPREHLVAT